MRLSELLTEKEFGEIVTGMELYPAKVALADSTRFILKEELHKRCQFQQPDFIYRDLRFWVSGSSIRSCNQVVSLLEANTYYTLAGCEVPLHYWNYGHYRTSKVEWAAGHSSASLGSHSYACVFPSRIDAAKHHRLKGVTWVIRKSKDHDNYWHWIFDCLAPLILFQTEYSHIATSINNIVIQTTCEVAGFQRDSIARIASLFPRAKIIIARSDLLLDQIVYYIPPSPLIHHSETLMRMRDEIKRVFEVGKVRSPFRKLYISRGVNRNGRAFKTEMRLLEMLSKEDYTVFEPGMHSIQKQLLAFGEAKIVVGPHGSAFVNALGMRQGATVIELLGKSYTPIHDMILCKQLGIKYDEVILPSIGKTFTSDFYADDAQLERIMGLCCE
jgi:hypothetical protein